MENYVINPLTKEELLGFLDEKSKEIIKYFIIKSFFSQPEPIVGQRPLPIQIPKEHIEQWFTQALDVEPVGAGSYPVDIYNEREHWGADVKMLSMTVDGNGDILNRDSGEASLGQKFADDDINLDTLFISRNHEAIRNKWVSLYKLKYENLKIDYPEIDKIYYFFILRPSVQESGASLYFTGAVIDLSKIDSVTVNTERTTENSVFLSNFISDEYGNTKIYKAKKRLELRLRSKKWIDENKAIKIVTTFNPVPVNLREKNIGEEYMEEEIRKMQDIEITFVTE